MQTLSKNAPMPVVRRLPKYHRYLKELLEEGIYKISSKDLSARMGLTASQIRQDLNYFGGFGQQGYGYNVEDLIAVIEDILSINTPSNYIIIGAGNLGKAITNYIFGLDGNAKVCAMFDSDENKAGLSVKDIPIYHMKELENFTKENVVDIAILAVPKTAGLEVAQEIIKNNIKAIWNFSTADLELDSDIVIENVAINESFYVLTYLLSENHKNA
jgi:redox-sensing transcriptional repressor